MSTMILLALIAGCSSNGSDSNGGSNGDDSNGGTDDTGTYAPKIDPADFSTTIDNPYFPLPVGVTYVSMDNGDEEVNVTVTSDTRVVMGVETVIVHDVVTDKDEKILEDTYDWYAQDKDGNVWYFGEDTTAYEDGKADTEGSWEGGVDGAQPGIIMKAHPKVGDSYRQEYLPGVAEDSAEVTDIDKTVTIGMGTYKHCVETSETTALEPDLVEVKDYGLGLGEIKAEDVTGGDGDHSELIEVITK
jgi:hypothetical protein